MAAPTHFSVVDNTIETVEFLNRVAEMLTTGPVHIAMRDVQRMTPDALLALVTYADALRRPGRLTGDMPTNQEARTVATSCGFDQLVEGLRADSRRARSGFVRTHRTASQRGYRSEPRLAESFVREACETAGLPYHRQSYSNLIECMTNTNNHSGRKRASVAWRLMIACDRAAAGVRFMFMDPGLGICRTVALRLGVNVLGDVALLETLFDPRQNGIKRLLTGNARRTRTRRPGRGRGLLKIAQSVERGQMRRLVVVSNGGFLDLSAGTSQSLARRAFRGTMIYWEVGFDPGAVCDVSQNTAE
jgi:hypothetical protein